MSITVTTADLEMLREYLEYDPATGIFTHIKKIKHAKRKIGDVAGSETKTGYLRVVLFGNEYLLHRVAWLFTTGELPNVVDHRNRIGTDNRILNLRSGTTRDNSKNMKMDRRNTSGVKGVHYCDSKWIAKLAGRFIGQFDSKEDAVNARVEAALADGYSADQDQR